jgi:hypothetical protein
MRCFDATLSCRGVGNHGKEKIASSSSHHEAAEAEDSEGADEEHKTQNA